MVEEHLSLAVHTGTHLCTLLAWNNNRTTSLILQNAAQPHSFSLLTNTRKCMTETNNCCPRSSCARNDWRTDREISCPNAAKYRVKTDH